MDEILNILGPPESLSSRFALFSYVGLIRKCMKSRDLLLGSSVHVRLVKLGFDGDTLVSNVLLDMYAKAGSLGECFMVFDKMPVRDLVSWCTMISGCVRHGCYLEAIGLFNSMRERNLVPNGFVFASVLKGCSDGGGIDLGLQVHGLIMKSGFGLDQFIKVGLIDMYAKCRVVTDARKLFHSMPVKSLVCWNAVISGHARNGFLVEAVELGRGMFRMGIGMDLVTLRILTNVGSALENVDICKSLHACSIKIGLEDDNVVVTEFVRLLAKLGDVLYMRKLFHDVKKADMVLFSLIISEYHEHGHRTEALKLVRDFVIANSILSEGALVSILGLCLYEEEGTQYHARFLKMGDISFLSIRNALMSMYMRCGNIKEAIAIFKKMAVRDLVSWTAVISGHVQNLQFGEALKLFRDFRKTNMVLDAYLAATIINVYTGLRLVDQGKQMHAFTLKVVLEMSDFLKTSLLHLYAKCGYIESASKLFSSISGSHSLVSINVMLAGYCWNSQAEKAVELFSKEYYMGLVPDEFSYSTILGACADLRSIEFGEQILPCITKRGFWDSDIVVGNAIMNLFVKCGSIASAHKSFNSMRRWNANSYAILMVGYVQNGSYMEALTLFYRMHLSGLSASPAVIISIIRVCSDIAATDMAKQIHASVSKTGLMSDAFISNAMMGMYVKLSDMDSARRIFDDVLIRDDVMWNAMITGYSQTGNTELAYELFKMMRWENVHQDYHSYVGVLNACAGAATLHQGTCVHARVIQSGFKSDVSVGNALVDMYAKCGSIEDAWKVFEKMEVKDVVSWNAMVSGYSQNGCAAKALELFKKMKMEGIKPDHITYIAVLSACSHVGLVDEGITYFKEMMVDHKIAATEEHYACMVDMLGRAGRIDDAHGFISGMPVEPSGITWRTLLAACNSHGNSELGTKVALKILDIERDDSAANVLLSNIYAMSERWVDVEIVRDGMRVDRVKKEPGFSWVDVQDAGEAFLVGGKRKLDIPHFLIRERKTRPPFGSHPQDWG
ncbi:Pentatricopeptide repeat-containing protein [Acorus gramineus]|uniref:Pentatricopeptide repeat-containing protein n=1 Tax=Acorus gramineus TaxID=55184 RepID=A0AAV9ALL7_ACOGR|nr:Pentatricopeptide repeat-containing protein [Acorus gramineus]